MSTQISSSFLIRLISKIENNPSLIEKIEAIIADVFLTVKAGISLAQRIAAGNYDRENDFINESNFPHDPTTEGEWEFRLVHPNRNISSEDAVVECEKPDEKGPWEVGKLEHLNAFGEAFSEEQKKYPIVELGSVCKLDGNRLVAKLWYIGSLRYLDLSRWGGDWNPSYRFLSVRRVS